MYNAALFYQYGGLYAELNYNYTGDRLYDLRSSRPNTYIQPVTKANLILDDPGLCHGIGADGGRVD